MAFVLDPTLVWDFRSSIGVGTLWIRLSDETLSQSVQMQSTATICLPATSEGEIPVCINNRGVQLIDISLKTNEYILIHWFYQR